MSKTISVDLRQDSYKTFFDHKWAESVLDQSDGTPFDQITFDLCMAWRGAANTHVLPYIMAEQLRAFAEPVVNDRDPFGRKWIQAVTERLPKEMGNSLRANQRHRMQSVLNRIYDDACKILRKCKYRFPVDEYWEKCLENSEFQMSLWGSQRLCYAGVYYAYEDFLMRCFKVVTGVDQYEIHSRSFNADLADGFGAQLRDRCWCHRHVNIARLVRHAIVHNGARVTSKLSKQQHSLKVVDGEIYIMAPDTTKLFNLLKIKAIEVLSRAIEITAGPKATQEHVP